jgi:hypothetical protein
MQFLLSLVVFLTLLHNTVCDAACYTATGLAKSAFPRCTELVQNQLWVAWKISGSAIEMAISRKGTGWMAIGIGEEQSGSMKGADMIVVSKINGDGNIVAEDRYATSFGYPDKDALQNVELLSTVEKDGMFQAVVRRPRMTCDVQDVAIRDDYPHMLLYAFGGDGVWAFNYHGSNNRGVLQTMFTGQDDGLKMWYDAVQKSNPDHLVIRYKNYHIPTADRPLGNGKMREGTNQYKCLAVPIENATNMTPPFDIVAGSPITSKYLHHFVNSACRNDPRPDPSIPWGQDQDNDVYNCAMGAKSAAACTSIPGWAAGGGPFAFGPESGTRIEAGTKWFVFDTHYYNPTMDKNAYDSSGFDYTVTPKLRPKKSATVWIGVSTTMRIPHGQKRANYAQHCPAEAIQEIFPTDQDTIEVTNVVHHLHQRANGAFTYIVRDGHRIPLVMQRNYDYNFQGGNPVKITLKRGDALEVHCQYDTTQDTTDVRWGERTQDEMCISIINFNPAPERATTFHCLNVMRNGNHRGIMTYSPAGGGRTGAHYFDQAAIHATRGYPVADANGNYDVPWGIPIDPRYMDYGCKANNSNTSSGPISTKLVTTTVAGCVDDDAAVKSVSGGMLQNCARGAAMGLCTKVYARLPAGLFKSTCPKACKACPATSSQAPNTTTTVATSSEAPTTTTTADTSCLDNTNSGCNTLTTESACLSSKDGRSAMLFSSGHRVYGEPCVWCGSAADSCGIGNGNKCEPYDWLQGSGYFQSQQHTVASCQAVDRTKLAGQSEVAVPDADAVIGNEAFKGALKEAFAASFGLNESHFTKFDVSKTRRLLIVGEADTVNPSRRIASGTIKVEYEVDLTGVANAAKVVADAKAVSKDVLATNIKSKMSAVGYPDANNIVVQTMVVEHPAKAIHWSTYGAGQRPCGGEGTNLAGVLFKTLPSCKDSCAANTQCTGFAWNSRNKRCHIKHKKLACFEAPCDWGSDKADWNWYYKRCEAATTTGTPGSTSSAAPFIAVVQASYAENIVPLFFATWSLLFLINL